MKFQIRKLFETYSIQKGVIHYFKNTGWLIFEQILRLLAGLFVGVYVARFLGPNNYGILAYSLSLVAIFSAIPKFGLDTLLVRELVMNTKERDLLLGTAFWLKLFGALITFLIVLFVVQFSENSRESKVYILIIACGLFLQSFEVIEFYFQSRVQAKIISICKISQNLISSTIKLILIAKNAELIYFVIVTVLDSTTLALAYITSYRLQNQTNFIKKFNFLLVQKLLKDSWPLILSAIVVTIYMRIDQIMIKQLLNPYEAGIYSAAVRISEVSFFIPVAICASLFPAIINSKKLSTKLYYNRLQNLYGLMVWLGVFFSMPFLLFGTEIITLLFGPEYSIAGEVLKIHVCSYAFVFLGVAFSKYLIAQNYTKIDFYRTCIGALCNVSLNYFLILELGVIGAAYATVISQFIANIAYDFFDKRLYQQLNMKFKTLLFPFKIIESLK